MRRKKEGIDADVPQKVHQPIILVRVEGQQLFVDHEELARCRWPGELGSEFRCLAPPPGKRLGKATENVRPPAS